MQQAGHPAKRFVLAVTDSPELNAYACGGHVVAVSTGALELLPDDELHGVLAHELGHHLGLHTVALTITHWLSLPIITLARVGFLLERARLRRGRDVPPRSAGLALIGRIVSAVLQLLAWAFLATVLIARRIGDRLGRSAEFAADQRAWTWATGDTWRSPSAVSMRSTGRTGGGRPGEGHRQPPLADAPLGPHRGPPAHGAGLNRHGSVGQ